MFYKIIHNYIAYRGYGKQNYVREDCWFLVAAVSHDHV